MWGDLVDVGVLKGLTLSKVEVGDDTVDFETTEGRTFQMYHAQDCCEYVRLEDVAGDVKDLVGSALVMAEQVSNEAGYEDNTSDLGSLTWTFYKLATQKGYVTLRWCGESNGYYSERVDFKETKKREVNT